MQEKKLTTVDLIQKRLNKMQMHHHMYGGPIVSKKIITWLILKFGNLLSTNALPKTCWRLAEQNMVTLQLLQAIHWYGIN